MARGVRSIGICAAIERARWTVWSDVEVNVSPRTYSRGVQTAGGLPLLLPARRRRAPRRPTSCSTCSTR